MTDDKIRLIFTHNNGNPPLHKWMREAKRCLIKIERQNPWGGKIQIGFRQPQNLKRVVSKKKNIKKLTPTHGVSNVASAKFPAQF